MIYLFTSRLFNLKDISSFFKSTDAEWGTFIIYASYKNSEHIWHRHQKRLNDGIRLLSLAPWLNSWFIIFYLGMERQRKFILMGNWKPKLGYIYIVEAVRIREKDRGRVSRWQMIYRLTLIYMIQVFNFCWCRIRM